MNGYACPVCGQFVATPTPEIYTFCSGCRTSASGQKKVLGMRGRLKLRRIAKQARLSPAQKGGA
jgi:hypothetical protein